MANLATCWNRPRRRLTAFICGAARRRPRNETGKMTISSSSSGGGCGGGQFDALTLDPCRQPGAVLSPALGIGLAAAHLNNGPLLRCFLSGAGGQRKSGGALTDSAPLPYGIWRVKWGSRTPITVSAKLCIMWTATFFFIFIIYLFSKLAANLRDIMWWKRNILWVRYTIAM